MLKTLKIMFMMSV